MAQFKQDRTGGAHVPQMHIGDDLNRNLQRFVGELIDQGIDLQFAKREFELAFMHEVLRRNDNNIGIASKALGVHRNTLSKRVKEIRNGRA